MAILEGFSGLRNPNVGNMSAQKLIVAQQVRDILQTKHNLSHEGIIANSVILCKTKTSDNSAKFESCFVEQRQSYNNFEVVFTHMLTFRYENYKKLSQLYDSCLDMTIDKKTNLIDWVAVKDCYYAGLKNIG